MSSEEKILEPSEKTPSPPPSSSGTTPTGSPAPTDRRPRGRPRKDAVTLAVPPPPTPKPKKKSRGRGRGAVDGEDSVDGMETVAESGGTQETDTKEQQEQSEGTAAVGVSGEEEEKPSSPHLSSIQTEETEESSSSAPGEAKSSERLCAFCNCGGRSLLGQGDLRAFEATPVHIRPADHKQSTRNSQADRDHGDKSGNGNESERHKGPESAEDSGGRFLDELHHVGLPDDVDVQSLFDTSGLCWAHQKCALWSQGVCQAEDQSLLNVDRAIHSGSTKYCAYCKRLGASIKCCEEGCDRLYHYPCAGAAGTFQDFRKLSLLCTEHIELAVDKSEEEANCALCDSPGELQDQFFCTSCGQHYHGMCLDITVTPLKRAGWQCPECKVCQTCKNPGEDTKMLVCDVCDKGYHTFCLQPVMDTIPTNGWRCKNCRVCIQCGARSSGLWHQNSLLCDGCAGNQVSTLTCSACANGIDPEHSSDLLCCHRCKRCFHLQCERQVEGQEDVQPGEDFVCSICKHAYPESGQTPVAPEPGEETVQGRENTEGDSGEPVQSHMDSEPYQADSEVELVEAVSEVELEKSDAAVEKASVCVDASVERVGQDISEPLGSGVTRESTPVPRPAQEIKPDKTESEERAQQSEEPDSEQLAASTEAEQAQRTPELLKHPDSKTPPSDEELKPCPEEQKVPSQTKEPTAASEEEPMDVCPAEEVSGTIMETEASAAKTMPKVEEKGQSLDLVVQQRKESVVSPSEEVDSIVDGGRSLAKLSLLVEEKTTLKPSQCWQPEGSSSPAQSSFNQGTSPKEPSQAQPSSTLGELNSNVPSATFIPLTPKIGMGKPAISKRKFSPGRPRVKHGAWSASRRIRSPSQSPEQAEGWDAPKTRQPPSTAGWSIRVGRGSGFPGRRRPRGAGLSGRGGRGRSRMKNGVSPVPAPAVNSMETLYPFREEEENAMHNTLVLFSSTDTFTMKQDMCVVCGSFGQGVEGRLLACAQCGQCYHPFCVNIKITKVVLSKGWRCLECTVCEACGQATDPGRLLLCDDCDISYHTYCLDPPLQNVPNGSWKCKWCVSCTQCGATSPGRSCEWQNNYTQCAPCSSLAMCPVCQQDYNEDELILQCGQCDRWMHASCQGFHSEEEVEKVADNSFDCSLCQGHSSPSQMAKLDLDTTESSVPTQMVSKTKDLDLSRTYTQDGVCLTESGLSQLQSLANTATRRKRPKPKLKLKIINQNSVAVLQTPPDPPAELSRDMEVEDAREGEPLECEGKSDSSPERETGADDDSKGVDGGKKRKRKPYRPGIGGFMVRQRNRTGPGKAKPALSRKDSTGSVSETPQGREEGWTDPTPDTPLDEKPPASEFPEHSEVKIRKRYRKKKTKLEEAFPTYLQEAFFGKDLLDKSKQSRQETTGLLEDERTQSDRKQHGANFPNPSADPVLSTEATSLPAKPGRPRSSEEPLVDLSEVLKADTELLGMLSGNMGKQNEDSGLDFCPFQVDCSPSPFAGLDIAPLSEEGSAMSSQPHSGRASRQAPEEPLDGILSPELDKMVTDESILSKLYKIPELEGKDVEDLFTAVLSPSASQPSQMPQPTQAVHPLHGPSGPGMPSSNLNSGMFPRMPVMNGLMEPNRQFPPSQMPAGAGPGMTGNFPPVQRMPFSDNPRERKFNQMAGEAVGPWTATGAAHMPVPTPVPEGEGDSMSSAQKSTLKWEKEETLGDLATVAPVLYTNVNFPNLKEEYPDWSTRVKQIAKLWRKASSQDRAPYVQKARDNRAALRINKVQMSNESIKRPQQPQQLIDVFDPSIPPLDTDQLFKDPLKHKESEHEQEWKLRQQMRLKSKQQAKIEATQKLEQVKNEQLQQQQQQHRTGGQSELESSSSLQSPGSAQPNNGNTSPMQQPTSKNGFSKPQLSGTPTSASPDDVFLRPQPPPTSTGSQPQSPQMFSPSSSGSRPSSPWDPYAKMVGTPRPPPIGPNTPRRNSESGKSPRAHSDERMKPPSALEAFGSPTTMNSDPYAKPPDTPRPSGPADPFLKPMGPPRGSQTMEGRHHMGSPGHGTFSRSSMRKEVFQQMPQGRMILSDPYARPLLTPIPGSNESGSVQVFKAPMPPHQTQDSYLGTHSRRASGDPFDRPALPQRPSDGFSQNQQSDPYAQPPLTPRPAMSDGYVNQSKLARPPQGHPFAQPGPMARHPASNPYSHAPSTPRPEYSQCDPYSQPPGTPMPMSNPCARIPGTPRPHDPYPQSVSTQSPSTDPYSQPPLTPRPAIMNQPPQHPQQQPPNRILSPSMSADPYAQPPGTPHPGMAERFPRSPGRQRNPDPYALPPGTPRPIAAEPLTPSIESPQSLLNDPYAHPPGTPRPTSTGHGMRHGLMSNQDPFSPPQVRIQDSFANPTVHSSQTPKHLGMSDENVSQSPSSHPNQTPVHDPFEQTPMTAHHQTTENREETGLRSTSTSVSMGQPNSAQMPGAPTEAQTVPLAEAEERLRQRQRIRELLRRQHQEKNASRQGKSPQEQSMTMPPGAPQHWNQEPSGQQNDIFSRPPPPYPGPGTIRGSMRFPGPFPGDQQGQFPEGHFSGPQFPGDVNNIRQLPPRFGYPPGAQGPLIGPRNHQMPEPMIEAHPQMRRSMSVDLGKSLGGNSMIPQHLPPRGMHVQQHNIMGQPFIELRHRAPENRLRLPFGPPAVQGSTMESPSQPQRPGFMSGPETGVPMNPNPVDPMINQTQGMAGQMQMALSMENLQQSNVPVRSGLQQTPLMRSMSQPASSETYTSSVPMHLSEAPAGQTSEVTISNEGAEVKLDTDESAVKDLEDVEVKDLVDADLENLNLDPEDGKDLDLETNDLHLVDFLTSGKFDIIAYTDPELDLSEDLDLSDPMDDHTDTSDLLKAESEKKNASSGGACSSTHSLSEGGKAAEAPEQSEGQIKQEVGLCQSVMPLKEEQEVKNEVKNDLTQTQDMSSCKDQSNENTAATQATYGSGTEAKLSQTTLQVPKTGIHPDATPVLSSLLVKVSPGDESLKQAGNGQTVMQTNPTTQTNPVAGLQQTVSSPTMTPGSFSQQGMNTSVVSSHGQSSLDMSVPIQGQTPGQMIFGMGQQETLLSGEQQQPSNLTQAQQALLSQQGQQNRPLLLEEQPLLLQDLLDQERQEQQQQRQMQAMIRQRSSDSFFPNIDFDAITDPIMKAKMVALKGINKVMVQNNMGMTQMVMNRFQAGGPPAQGPPCPDGSIPTQQTIGQDGKLAPHMARPNPPNFGPGFSNDAQKAQYEEWLRETQQLLQMQQKFLEEQIGAHRKSKKALSAKQRTAKKAGREFPEEDAEQLKHVTEQQGVVQKQLEQIRKQQKEHAELIEEYRVKQQQCNMQSPMMPGIPPMQGHPGMVPTGPPVNQPLMTPMMPMQHHPGQPNPPRMPSMQGWHPGASLPLGGPRMPTAVPPQALPAQPLQPPSAVANHGQPGNESSHVNFDDTNPFSEGFQERERKERLREQQERQRVQLMKEVERQRALKQRMEMEQQQGLSQMPFYNQELPQDFMQPHRPQQQLQGPGFPQQRPGLGGIPSGTMMANGPFPQEVGSGFVPDNPPMHGVNFIQGQPRPPRFMGPNMMPQNPGEGHGFGVESSTPLPPNFPGSGPSLIQLYSNIIPEEKGKKRSRKKKKDDDSESVKAPSTPHSDLTAPLTPCVSDTSSTPTRNPLLSGEPEVCESSQPGSSTPGSLGSQPHSELERQLSESSCGGGGDGTLGQLDTSDRILSNIKLEKMEASDCHGPKGTEPELGMGMVKIEGEKETISPQLAGQNPVNSSKGEAGNELLKHLLKYKGAPPGLPHQKSEDSLRSEEDGSIDSKVLLRQNSLDSNGTFSDCQLSGHPDLPGPLLPEHDKKKQRNKRLLKGSEKPAPRSKKRKKEEEDKQAMFSTPEPAMTNLKQQLSLLPLMEPLIGVNFAHFVPYGSGQLNGESRLSGTFGSASLDGVSDYYSQLIYKQNNLSNPPTPPASLPPTPPPVARQKLLNGFATTEELANKAAVMDGHDVSKGLLPRPLHVQFKAEEELLVQALAQGPKTVDVPASLPTPPHNNQEELRGQEHIDERDTPDSFVPSSSPESVVGAEISRYPDLSLVKEEPPSPAQSPVIPLFPSSKGKGLEARLRDVKTEPSSVFFGSPFGPAQNCANDGLVSIAITLKPAAAENITDVVAAIADLIRVKMPSSYEVSSAPASHGALGAFRGSMQGPEHRPSNLLQGPSGHGGQPGGGPRFSRHLGLQEPVQQKQFPPSHLTLGPAGAREQCQKGRGSPGLKPQWCRHCKVVVLGNGVRKTSKDPPSDKGSQEDQLSSGDLVFCSHSCLILHSSSQSKANTDTKASAALLAESKLKESPSKAQHQYSNNMSSLDVHCLAQLQPKSPPLSPIPVPAQDPNEPVKTELHSKFEEKPDSFKVTVKLKHRSHDSHPDNKPWYHGKRCKGLRWRKWTVQVVVPKGVGRTPEDEAEVDELLQKLCASLRPCPSTRDRRRCCFCHQEGDGVTDGPARLLNLDLDTWVHLNCALWSTEVYETQAGALINVELARQRGQTLACAFCQRIGATSGCHRLRCANVYHFTCALQAGCTFFKDKTMLCHAHRPRGSAGSAGLYLEHQLRCFAVFRRVYVQRDELRQLAGAVQRPERGHTFRVGSLLFHAMGQLPAAHMPAFHSSSAIFPPGYEASRLYWSMRHGGRRCRYICSVEERQGKPEFTIRVKEQGYEDLVLTDTTAKGVWDKVLGPVAERRAETGMLRLFPVYLKGEDLFGLTVSAVTRIAESLPGVEACERYRFRYGRNSLLELPLAVNPSGSARSEFRNHHHQKRPNALFVRTSISLSIQNSAPPEGGSAHSKHFVHSKSSQYRRLTSEWKSNVYLAHSRIQGLGLFAARDIEKQTMVIEYLGDILRNEVALRKELIYKAKNRSVYMFRIDSEHVIDASRSGSPARYINHSCSPNCVAEVVTFERGYKIIISSNRKIEKGEELCYDYKLAQVDDQHKIPCLCGADNCRKWIN
ncbi:histone-lysine N-methyltransferase 2C [Chanos chanos]|uniref:Histone-lysine N-methyltransferase 2C n=1 Tax=Chanos chanos TaxID=29144 RepID=A0A6J2VB86_CHACN|nr:histone-lysine N-methyltransferase 2C-like [Chanos chanos]